MRIGQFLSRAGMCSRREAANFLINNTVIHNTQTIRRPDYQISETETLVINGIPVNIRQLTEIILLNKPPGYVCTHKSQGDQKIIFDLLPADKKNYFYAGRLDEESRGLIVLSNNGDLIHSLSHPSLKSEKIYNVRTSRPLSPAEMSKLKRGIMITGVKMKFHEIEPASSICSYTITLQEGRNRQIRRMLEALQVEVIDLCRISLGPYLLDDIKEGKYIVVPHNILHQ